MNDTFARSHNIFPTILRDFCNGSLTLVRIIIHSSSYSTHISRNWTTSARAFKTLGNKHHFLCACRLSSYHIELQHFAKCLIQILKCCHWSSASSMTKLLCRLCVCVCAVNCEFFTFFICTSDSESSLKNERKKEKNIYEREQPTRLKTAPA